MRENKTHTQTRLSVGLMIPGFPALIVRQTKLTACELLQLIIPIPARIYMLYASNLGIRKRSWTPSSIQSILASPEQQL